MSFECLVDSYVPNLKLWVAGLGVVELVQVEVIRFTHKLNCFDGNVSHSWIY